MRKAFLFARDALKFIAWAVIPFFVLACSTAKSVQNKHLLQHDTIIIRATDTIQQVRWLTRTDTLRERIYERDSTSQRQQGDTIIREIWHWRERTADRSRTETDSLAMQIKSLMDRLRATSSHTQDVEIQRKEPPWTERMIFIFGLSTILFIIIYVYRFSKKSER